MGRRNQKPMDNLTVITGLIAASTAWLYSMYNLGDLWQILLALPVFWYIRELDYNLEKVEEVKE
jgi:hypothetical protein